MRTKLFALVGLVCSAMSANNISVSNVSLVNPDAVANTVQIACDVSWDNSWRTITNESNYDGAWLFAKYRLTNGQEWRHCTMYQLGIVAGTGATIVAPFDKRGVFIHRAPTNLGIGNVNFAGNRLVWDYGADGVADGATVEIRLFALEMVYIPTGSYWLGTGGTEANAFRTGSANTPYKITANAAVPINNTTGLSFNGLGTGTSIPATFPNGYESFWIMKYEATQQQMADFFNTLTGQQATSLHLYANNLTGSYPNFLPVAAEHPYVCQKTNLNYKHVAAFAEWSGLRPYSEMEFEKACRGVDVVPFPNEYAWGSDTITPLTTIFNEGQANETILTGSAENAHIANIFGSPVRVGIFARSTGSSRVLSGATYYGVMNMSDNVFEIVVNSGTVEGRAVSQNVNGSGSLDAQGFSGTPAWQNLAAFMRRGSSYFSSANILGSMEFARVSNRNTPVNVNNVAEGIRLARNAP